MSMGIGIVVACGMCTLGGVPLHLQTTTDLDRWMYPFNGSPGFRTAASTFTAIGQEEVSGFTFDQRDGQVLLGFDSSGVYPTARPACQYVVDSVVLRATISRHESFAYDPTQDDFCTYITDVLDPDFCGGDTDVGTGLISTARPIELFGIGYRNGFGLVNAPGVTAFTEVSPHGTIQKEMRNLYPIDGNVYPSIGLQTMTDDVSNNVRDRFNPTPWALGIAPTLVSGDTVPADTEFVFTLDAGGLVAGEKMYEYVREGLRSGRLHFLLTALQPATTDGGGGSGEFAEFFTKEDVIFGIPATIEVFGSLTCDGDANSDFAVDVNDISYVLFRLGDLPNGSCGCLQGDANGDGIVDVNDISYVLFRLGTCDTS